jgi:soluble lytic murein transglycosylase-like protein
VFAERISFVETRDYVRIIQRNEEIYRGLYAEQTQQAQAAPPGQPDSTTASEHQM